MEESPVGRWRHGLRESNTSLLFESNLIAYLRGGIGRKRAAARELRNIEEKWGE